MSNITNIVCIPISRKLPYTDEYLRDYHNFEHPPAAREWANRIGFYNNDDELNKLFSGFKPDIGCFFITETQLTPFFIKVMERKDMMKHLKWKSPTPAVNYNDLAAGPRLTGWLFMAPNGWSWK